MRLIRAIIRPWYRAKVRLHRRSYVLGALMHVGTVVAIAFIAIFVFTFYILQPYEVSGMSMYPTLHDGDRLFILRTGKIFANLFGTDYVPERGEIIVFESRVNDDKWIKRIVGLPEE
ncbi:signal peptidase I [Candidatus Saccharibacteria bacterium]|nr:signal peptidase I [Candidatus Saccharibacteria bacterium]